MEFVEWFRNNNNGNAFSPLIHTQFGAESFGRSAEDGCRWMARTIGIGAAERAGRHRHFRARRRDRGFLGRRRRLEKRLLGGLFKSGKRCRFRQ